MLGQFTAPKGEQLTPEQIFATIEAAFQSVTVSGKKILVIIPDRTRTAPIPTFFRGLCSTLGRDAAKLDFLIALGTHSPLSESEKLSFLEITEEEKETTFKRFGVYNHNWTDPNTFANLGVITRNEIEQIAGEAVRRLDHDAGLLRDVPVTLNRMILDYDLLVICGPTFPHEVVGFSGGNKYFFPGIAGPEVINFSHWLGAVISNYEIIGTKNTPVREVIDKAASMIPIPRLAISFVVQGNGVSGLYISTPEEAWDKAATLSAELHIKWLEKPVYRVLSVMPKMYTDIWTAGKGMYKLEPAVRDGGEVIIYSPWITEVSYSHGKILDEIGYHVCDYFLKQWDKFKHFPGGVLAHSSHVKGQGSFDAATGKENPRIRVTLATGIPEGKCRALGLGYLPVDSIDPEKWAEQGPDHLCIPRAGEILYRVRPDMDQRKP